MQIPQCQIVTVVFQFPLLQMSLALHLIHQAFNTSLFTNFVIKTSIRSFCIYHSVWHLSVIFIRMRTIRSIAALALGRGAPRMLNGSVCLSVVGCCFSASHVGLYRVSLATTCVVCGTRIRRPSWTECGAMVCAHKEACAAVPGSFRPYYLYENESRQTVSVIR